MARLVKDRVKETSSTTGTGTLTLDGPVVGFQSFAAIGNGNETYYVITDDVEWEVGIGTYTAAGTLLSRDTVIDSSNAGALVNFGPGGKQVFCSYPAGFAADTVTPQILENKKITEGVFVLTGTTPVLSLDNGALQIWQLTANSTPTDGLASGQSMTLFINAGGPAYTVTWPSVVWVGAVEPVIVSAGSSIVELFKIGTTLYGAYVGDVQTQASI